MRLFYIVSLCFMMLGFLKAPRQNMMVFNPASDSQKTIGTISNNPTLPLNETFIVVGEKNGWVRLYDLKRRSTIWWVQLSDRLSAASLIGNDIFLSDLSGELTSVDFQSGKASWTKKHQGYTFKKPINAPCGIIIQTANQQIVCYDIKTGQEKFTTPLGSYSGAAVIRSYTKPVVHNGQVFAASDAGIVLKLDGITGKILQKSAPLSVGAKFRGVIGNLFVSGQSILFGEYGGKLNKLDVSTLKITQSVSFGRLYDVKYNSNSVLISSKNGSVKSLDLNTFQEKWAYQHDENVSHLQWVSDSWYGVGSRGSLFSLSVSGQLRWRDFLETELRQNIFKCMDSICFSSASSSLYFYKR